MRSLAERANVLLDSLFAPRFLYEVVEGGGRVNQFARQALNLLGLHGALVRCYQALEAAAVRYPPPVRDFRDALVFTTAAFYQQDPARNVWHLDEFVALHFRPCLGRFLDALEAGT